MLSAPTRMAPDWKRDGRAECASSRSSISRWCSRVCSRCSRNTSASVSNSAICRPGLEQLERLPLERMGVAQVLDEVLLRCPPPPCRAARPRRRRPSAAPAGRPSRAPARRSAVPSRPRPASPARSAIRRRSSYAASSMCSYENACIASLPGVSGFTRANAIMPQPPTRPATSFTLEGCAPRRSSCSRTSRSCSSVSRRCSANARLSSRSPATRGARRICASACSSIEWTSVRYLVSCSSISVMPRCYPPLTSASVCSSAAIRSGTGEGSFSSSGTSIVWPLLFCLTIFLRRFW